MDTQNPIEELVSRVSSLLHPLPKNPTPIVAESQHIESVIQKTILFKVITSRNIRRGHVIESMSVVWNLKGDSKIISQGDNIFRVTLQSKMEVDRLIREGPWIFENDLLVIERSRPRTLIKEYKFNQTDFWVQLSEIPFDLMQVDIIHSIASDIGEVLPIAKEEESKWLTYARVRVRINIDQPLKTKLLLPVEGNDRHMVEVRYEKLPRVCMLCRVIGHDMEECKILYEVEEALGRTEIRDADRQTLEEVRKLKLQDVDIRAPPPPARSRSHYYKGRNSPTSTKSPLKPSHTKSAMAPPNCTSPACRRQLLISNSESATPPAPPLQASSDCKSTPIPKLNLYPNFPPNPEPTPSPKVNPINLTQTTNLNLKPNRHPIRPIPNQIHPDPPNKPSFISLPNNPPPAISSYQPTPKFSPQKSSQPSIIINSLPKTNLSLEPMDPSINGVAPPLISSPDHPISRNLQSEHPSFESRSKEGCNIPTPPVSQKSKEILMGMEGRMEASIAAAELHIARANPSKKLGEEKGRCLKRTSCGPGIISTGLQPNEAELSRKEILLGSHHKRKNMESNISPSMNVILSPARSKAVKIHDGATSAEELNSQRAWAARQPRPQQ